MGWLDYTIGSLLLHFFWKLWKGLHINNTVRKNLLKEQHEFYFEFNNFVLYCIFTKSITRSFVVNFLLLS